MNPKDREGLRKAQLRHVPPILVIAASGPLKLGAEKYGSFNWRQEKISVAGMLEALERHLFAFLDMEDNDRESGLSHLAHIAAGCAILLDAINNDSVIDDRSRGNAAKALEDATGATSRDPMKIGPATIQYGQGSTSRLGKDVQANNDSRVPAPEAKLPIPDKSVPRRKFPLTTEFESLYAD